MAVIREKKVTRVCRLFRRPPCPKDVIFMILFFFMTTTSMEGDRVEGGIHAAGRPQKSRSWRRRVS